MTSNGTSHDVTYYEILDLGPPHRSKGLTKQEVKLAYQRALLLHHPDKARPANDSNTRPTDSTAKVAGPHYTVDQIVAAYNVLVDPQTRVRYNKDLALQRDGQRIEASGTLLHNGLEMHDLEDLEYDDETGVWYKGCRCGEKQSYVVTEAELEHGSKEGEIYVACKGCSLWIKVLFSMAEEEQ